MSLTRRDFTKRSLFTLSGLALLPTQTFSKAKAVPEKTILDYVRNITNNKKIILRLLYPQGALDNIKPVTDSFSAATNISFEFIQTTVDDINTKILIDTAMQKNSFDIALPSTFGIPDLAEAGALEDLSRYAEKYENKIGYSPSLYALGDRYKASFYGYQTDGDVYLMFFHKDCMQNLDEQKRFADKYGKPLALPTSWNELDQIMAFFHRPEQDKYGGCLFRTPRYMVWEWWIRFHAKGLFPVNDEMVPNIDKAPAIDALEEMIAASKFQHPSSNTNSLFDNWKLYGQGQCVVNVGWGGTQKYLNSEKSNMKDKLLFSPTPQVSYFNWGWNYVASAFSDNKEIAYLFSLYATLPTQSTLAIKNADGFFDPFREEHYQSNDIEQTYTRPFLQAHKQAMQTAIPDFYIQGQSSYMQSLEENIALANDGKITAKEALSFTAKRWEELTNAEGRESQIKQWLFLKAQYPQGFSAFQ